MKTKTAWIWSGVGGCVTAGLIGASVYDCPSPEINYTWHNLKVPAEVAASYDTLMHYRKNGTNELHIALSDDILELAGTWSNLLPHAEAIEQAWVGCEDARQYINDLNQFPFITDWNNPEEQPDMIEMPLPAFQMQRKLTQLYSVYATLQSQQNHVLEGINILVQHYTMVRKSLPYSTTLVSRMIFIAMANKDLQTADLIIRNSDCTQDQLKILNEVFLPLSDEDISWFRPLLSEYAGAQYVVNISMQKELVQSMRESGSIPKWASTKSFFFKPNQTLQYFQNFYEPMLKTCTRGDDPKPQIVHASTQNDNLFSGIRAYNPWNGSGRLIIAIMIPSLTKAYDHAIATQVKSELLALEIHKRQDEMLELHDPYTGAAYAFDEIHHRFYCIGPDGIDGTDDDIYINKPSFQPGEAGTRFKQKDAKVAK